MVFSQALFLSFFLPLVLGIYFLAQEKIRNHVLLAASLFFYAWGEPKAVFVMIALIAVSWQIGILLDRSAQVKRKCLLLLGVTLNLLTLFFYKYLTFVLDNVNLVLTALSLSPIDIPKISLPIGISFYVFQIVSYLIDVYRREVPAQKNFLLLQPISPCFHN